MTERKEPSKSQKRQFVKGFWWGRREHNLETYTTYTLLLGFFIQIAAIWSRKWSYCVIAVVLFGIALIFRIGAGISHKIERHYMRYLRFGGWKKNK